MSRGCRESGGIPTRGARLHTHRVRWQSLCRLDWRQFSAGPTPAEVRPTLHEGAMFHHRSHSRHCRVASLWLCLAIGMGPARLAADQELEPRAYTAAPTGVNFLIVAGGRST